MQWESVLIDFSATLLSLMVITTGLISGIVFASMAVEIFEALLGTMCMPKLYKLFRVLVAIWSLILGEIFLLVVNTLTLTAKRYTKFTREGIKEKTLS